MKNITKYMAMLALCSCNAATQDDIKPKLEEYIKVINVIDFKNPSSFNNLDASNKLKEAIKTAKLRVSKKENIKILDDAQGQLDSMGSIIERSLQDGNLVIVSQKVSIVKKQLDNLQDSIKSSGKERELVATILNRVANALTGLEKRIKSK